MAIPDYQTCMLPLLRYAVDQQEHRLGDAVQALAQQFKLTDAEVSQYLPSGQQPVFINRVGWARTYLKKAGLLTSPRRGFFCISERGLSVLKENPPLINVRYLERFDEFVDFRTNKKDDDADESSIVPDAATALTKTPHEALEAAHEQLRAELAGEVLQALKGSSPAAFEQFVVALLVKMGYGGSREDAGRAIGGTGDEGIDGVIKEDHLGLDNIYIQAKRWESTVGRPEIQKFAGALQGQRARKGIFITTSAFSKEASDYVSRIESKIVLIDGTVLAKLMIDFSVGVSDVATYTVKRLDLDYFMEQ